MEASSAICREAETRTLTIKLYNFVIIFCAVFGINTSKLSPNTEHGLISIFSPTYWN
jgi:hypothetical protein